MPASLLVQTEVVLEGGRCEGLALVLNRHALLRLDGLVQALGQAAAGHGAAGVLVDQHHLAILHDVLDVALEQRLRTQPGVHVVQQGKVGGRVEAVALLEQAFRPAAPRRTHAPAP
jgi:hypothetical protein